MGQNISLDANEPNFISNIPGRFIYGNTKKFYERDPKIYFGDTIKSFDGTQIDEEKLSLRCLQECNIDASCKGVSFQKLDVYDNGRQFQTSMCNLKSAFGQFSTLPENTGPFSTEYTLKKTDITEEPFAFIDFNVSDEEENQPQETRDLLQKIRMQNEELPEDERRFWYVTPPASVVAQQNAAAGSPVVLGPPVVSDSAVSPPDKPVVDRVDKSVVVTSQILSTNNVIIFAGVAVVLFFAIKYGFEYVKVEQETMKNMYVQAAMALVLSGVIVYVYHTNQNKK
jgi:hypothetical protein